MENGEGKAPTPNSRLPTPAIFIAGPTASGKSDLAMRVAKAYDGEIICADSQTVRRGMDVGTAKPTKQDQAEVPHHLLDIIDPYEHFNVSQFKTLAEKSIQGIQSRGKLPIIVGGTGLYIDALLYEFSFRTEADPGRRAELEAMSIARLQAVIQKNDYPMPKNDQNPRHLIRVIESEGQASEKQPLRTGALVVGLDPGKDKLEERIKQRVEAMMQAGLLDEHDKLIKTYGEPPDGFDGVEYKIVHDHRDAGNSVLKNKIMIGDRQYAKKQRSWLRRNHDITWFTDPDSAFEHIQNKLSSR